MAKLRKLPDYALSKRLTQTTNKWVLPPGNRQFLNNCIAEIEKLELQALMAHDLELANADLRRELGERTGEDAEMRRLLRKFLGIE